MTGHASFWWAVSSKKIRPATEKARRPYVESRWLRRYRQLMAGSGTKMLSRDSNVETGRQHAARYTGEQNRTDIGVWSHRVYTGHAGVRQVSGAQYASAASDRDRTSVYHWLHELPSSTLVATCWWLINYDNQVLLPASSSRISCRRVLWRVETIYVICLSNLCKLKCWIRCGSESAFM